MRYVLISVVRSLSSSSFPSVPSVASLSFSVFSIFSTTPNLINLPSFSNLISFKMGALINMVIMVSLRHNILPLTFPSFPFAHLLTFTFPFPLSTYFPFSKLYTLQWTLHSTSSSVSPVSCSPDINSTTFLVSSVDSILFGSNCGASVPYPIDVVGLRSIFALESVQFPQSNDILKVPSAFWGVDHTPPHLSPLESPDSLYFSSVFFSASSVLSFVSL